MAFRRDTCCSSEAPITRLCAFYFGTMGRLGLGKTPSKSQESSKTAPQRSTNFPPHFSNIPAAFFYHTFSTFQAIQQTTIATRSSVDVCQHEHKQPTCYCARLLPFRHSSASQRQLPQLSWLRFADRSTSAGVKWVWQKRTNDRDNWIACKCACPPSSSIINPLSRGHRRESGFGAFKWLQCTSRPNHMLQLFLRQLLHCHCKCSDQLHQPKVCTGPFPQTVCQRTSHQGTRNCMELCVTKISFLAFAKVHQIAGTVLHAGNAARSV